MKCSRLIAVLFLCAVGLIAPTPGSAARTSGTLADTTVNGLSLTVSVPKTVYPWNALVRVRLSVRNLTPQPLFFPQSCTDNPRVEAIREVGTVVYPPEPKDQPCVTDAPLRLDPGARLERRLYVVLRSRRVRAAVTVTVGDGNRTVVGDAVVLRLVRRSPPTMIMRTSPVIAAFVRPSIAARGPLFHKDVYQCGVDSDMTYWARTTKWTRIWGTRIVPHWPVHCGYPSEWDVTAGWLNEPVVKARYVDGASVTRGPVGLYHLAPTF